jgi:hypothetical protein
VHRGPIILAAPHGVSLIRLSIHQRTVSHAWWPAEHTNAFTTFIEDSDWRQGWPPFVPFFEVYTYLTTRQRHSPTLCIYEIVKKKEWQREEEGPVFTLVGTYCGRVIERGKVDF